MCSCAHCANVCVALILVFPLPSPPPLLLSSPFDGYTPTSSQFQTKLYLFIFPLFLHSYTLPHSTCPVPHRPLTTSSICPFIDPSIHPPPLVSSSQLPTSTPFLFSFTSHLWSLALPSLFLPHPVHFVLLPSSLPLSLSHSALCLALSGWAAPRWLRVCVHSGACRASPPPGLTTRFCLSPLNSAAPPPFPSLPPSPCPHPSLFFTHSI